MAVRRWTDDVRRDLGGDLTRAQQTILGAVAQSWVILSSLDDYIARQSTLVTRKRQVIPVVLQRMQIAEGLARNLERLGLIGPFIGPIFIFRRIRPSCRP